MTSYIAKQLNVSPIMTLKAGRKKYTRISYENNKQIRYAVQKHESNSKQTNDWKQTAETDWVFFNCHIQTSTGKRFSGSLWQFASQVYYWNTPEKVKWERTLHRKIVGKSLEFISKLTNNSLPKIVMNVHSKFNKFFHWASPQTVFFQKLWVSTQVFVTN